MADTQGLFDALAGAGGANINRPQMNSFIANSQANNGLRSAQTEEALLKAQESTEQAVAKSQLHGTIRTLFGPNDQSKADAATTMMLSGFGDAKSAMAALNEVQKNQLTSTISDPNQLGSPAQTAAQQGLEGKVATPVAVPNNYATLPGGFQPNVQQTPQGAAQTAQTNAMTGLDVARAEEEHAKAKNANNPVAGMDPGTVDMGADVVMADPTKMNGFAGFGQMGQANKNAINNRIASKLTAAGMTPSDMIRQRAIAHASLGGATQAAKQIQTMDAFTPLVRSNGDRILQLLGQVDDDGADMPILAGLQRAAGRNLGSDDLAELHSVFSTYQAEVARLLAAGPSMNGVVSDKARGDVQAMAPENMTTSQARRVINRVNTEIAIRRNSAQNSLEGAANNQLPVTDQPTLGAPPPAVGGGAAPVSSGTWGQVQKVQ